MKIVQLTPEIRFLASRYMLLLGFTNEVDAALTLGDKTPRPTPGYLLWSGR